MHVRFERSEAVLAAMPEDAAGSCGAVVIVGPYEWVQLTYNQLRVGPDGETIASYDAKDDVWRIEAPSVSVATVDSEHPFSDIVVY